MYVECPFCHHLKYSLYREKQELQKGGFYNIFKCNECGILYPHMRMDKEEVKNCSSLCRSAPEDYPFILQSEDLIIHFLKDLNKKGASLDIGTFNGRGTYLFQEMGFESYGIEPAEKSVEYAQNKGLRVFKGLFPDCVPIELLQKKYKLISMLEVIYYFHDLKKSLLAVKDMLEDNGYLLIQCHQGYSTYYTYYNKSYFSRYGDNVQGIPTLNSLMHCLTKTGFRPTKLAGFEFNGTDIVLYNTPETIKYSDRLLVLAVKGD